MTNHLFNLQQFNIQRFIISKTTLPCEVCAVIVSSNTLILLLSVKINNFDHRVSPKINSYIIVFQVFILVLQTLDFIRYSENFDNF